MVTKPVVFKNARKREVLAASCIILCIRALFLAYYLASTFSPTARVTLPPYKQALNSGRSFSEKTYDVY